jgi:hypothetical protein
VLVGLADPGSDPARLGVPGDVVAEVPDAAGGRPDLAGQQLEHGGFASPVRADQRVPGTRLHADRDVVDGP